MRCARFISSSSCFFSFLLLSSSSTFYLLQRTHVRRYLVVATSTSSPPASDATTRRGAPPATEPTVTAPTYASGFVRTPGASPGVEASVPVGQRSSRAPLPLSAPPPAARCGGGRLPAPWPPSWSWQLCHARSWRSLRRHAARGWVVGGWWVHGTGNTRVRLRLSETSGGGGSHW